MSAEEKLVSRSSVVPNKRRDLKSLMQDSDHDSSSTGANNSVDSEGPHNAKDNDNASCGAGASGNLGQENEVDDGMSISGSDEPFDDNEDRQLELKKGSRFLEASNRELTSSSSGKCHDVDEKVLKSNKRDETDKICVPPVPTSPESEVEEDVKVCDICGDAGREDLLAVCSRCSDGAEHTYCMREMLDKVPEGDWLCEECKDNELLEARQLDQSKRIGGHERNKYLGRTRSLVPDLSLKLDSKDPIRNRPKLRHLSLNRQSSSRMCGGRIDSCPTEKKQVLDSGVGSPPTSSPTKMAVLSKQVPSKILDKIKGKQNNQISAGTEIAGEFSENARSPTKNSSFVKGNFMKSNSFSSSNSKQNVKLSDDALPKHSVDAKEGKGKLIGQMSKSMSFRGVGRSTLNEPKVKMLPAKCAPFQDMKGLKHGKDRTSYERKNTMKMDNSLPAQIAADSSSRPPGVSDGISTLPVTSNHDYRSIQKLSNMSNHAGHFTHKSSDFTTNYGEVKKLSSTGMVGSTSVNGTNNVIESKLNHFSGNDKSSLTSPRLVDGSLTADGEGILSEKTTEKMSSSRQGFNSGMVSSSRHRLPVDAPALKSKDGMPGENKLKAAIEAAMQKKQAMLKKNKVPEKPVELSISNKEGNHREDAVSNQVRDPKSEGAMHGGDVNFRDINLETATQMTTIREKPIKLDPADFENSPARESVLTVAAIPDQESIWQGGFEIHRNGKPPDMRGGFQAHMSLFASGKVHEMVGKFPKKIIFSEVPRPCAWPAQFKELGPQEENIALYFFAKDSESYMRSYKILVDYMMKHDLALKGNINGVDLLVFPSNHLPHESKCWNTLYFIWGVFRGRKPRFLDDRFSSLGKCESSVAEAVLHKDVASAESPLLYKPAPEQLSVSGSDQKLVSRCEASVVEGSSLQQCADLSNGDCYKEEYSVGRTCLGSPIGAGNHKRPKHHYTILQKECPETMSTALRDECQTKPNRIVDSPKPAAGIHSEKNMPSEVMLDQQDGSHPLKLPLVGKQEGGDTFDSLVNPQLLDSESDYACKLKYENGVKLEKPKLENGIDKQEINLISDGVMSSKGFVDINVPGDNNSAQYSPKMHFHEGSDAATSITGKKRPWVDKIDLPDDAFSKSMNFSGCKLYGLEAQMGGVSSSSHIDTLTLDEANKKKSSAINSKSSEGCFFLDKIQPVENEDHDRLPGDFPSLELALGVKKKQAREGFLGFDRKDADVVMSSAEEEGDANASLSLSLGFPFLEKERIDRPPSPSATLALDQTVNTSLLLFRGSSGK